MLAVSVQDLHKAFGGIAALAGLDLSVPQGEIYGFLGPNGAGKSTALRILAGLIRADRGGVRLFGRPLHTADLSFRRCMGIAPDAERMPPDMTAFEYLTFFARLFEVDRAERRAESLLERVELSTHGRWPAHRLSRGQQQKLAIARSLLHDPALLLWDEPVSGLDAHGIRWARELLLALKREGKTVLLSSHILSEVERTADRIGILAGGRLVAEGTLAELQRRYGAGARLEVEVAEMSLALADGLRTLPFVRAVTAEGRVLRLELADEADRRAQISAALTACGGVVVGLRAEAISLEDLFLRLTPGKGGGVA